ncbi:hypothetical protein MRB53_018131 [Persea americana]|uniref:Uncharacterized protein n=1 Tax=Persea americana TaxID=3435 RepID=A0ACC2M711_PERAE|nr:hypothetical protein MRB53_018131 [Persea americana]
MMMTLVESSLVVGFRSSAMPSSIAFVGSCQPSCTISAATTNDQITLYPGWCRFGSHASRTFISRGIDHLTNVNNRGLWRNGLMRRSDLLKGSVVRAAATEHSGSTSDPLERKAGIRQSYHPFEEIEESVSKPDSEEAARLSDAEMTRTMIEVNSKATLMFSGMIDDEVHDNVVWPGLPYVTDEHGDIYFKVDSDEGIMQTLASESNVVKVIIGLDNMGIFTEMGLPGQSDIDFGIEEITDEDSDDDGDYENDDEDDDDDDDDDEVKFPFQITSKGLGCHSG